MPLRQWWPWKRRATQPAAAQPIAISEQEPRRSEEILGTEILQGAQIETPELGPLAQLPPLRAIAVTLIRLFDRPDVTLDEVAALVESDPSIASEILAVVNSPLFSVRQEISIPAHAIALLGLDRTKSLCAALAMRSLMQGGPREGVVRRFWRHSLATATIARHLAPQFKLAAEMSYVTALMHDLGRNGLLAGYPEEYAAIACAAHESTVAILGEETAAFGMTHCQAGAMLVKAWGLPGIFEQVTRDHHDPATATSEVALVRLSCQLADDLMYQAVHRSDSRKPETTLAEEAPESLRDRLAGELGAVQAAIDKAIGALDF